MICYKYVARMLQICYRCAAELFALALTLANSGVHLRCIQDRRILGPGPTPSHHCIPGSPDPWSQISICPDSRVHESLDPQIIGSPNSQIPGSLRPASSLDGGIPDPQIPIHLDVRILAHNAGQTLDPKTFGCSDPGLQRWSNSKRLTRPRKVGGRF